MKFSAKVEYGVFAAIDLAANYEGGAVRGRELAQRQGIPLRFLEQVMNGLKQRGIAISVRGPHGGYALAKPPDQIRLSEVITALDSGERPRKSSEPGGWAGREILNEVKKEMEGFLSETTLRDLARRKGEKEERRFLMYHI